MFSQLLHKRLDKAPGIRRRVIKITGFTNNKLFDIFVVNIRFEVIENIFDMHRIQAGCDEL